MGLDLIEGSIRDNVAAGVVEPALSKTKIIQFATEAVRGSGGRLRVGGLSPPSSCWLVPVVLRAPLCCQVAHSTACTF